MKLGLFTYFNFAGPNDFVSFTRGGKEVATGKGLAALLRPSTSVAVVPLGVKTVGFQVTERSQDRQLITVTGELVVDYVPEMRQKFDFSVYRQNGQYRNDPTAQIEDQVRIAVRGPLREALAEMQLDEIAAKGTDVLDQKLAAEVADAASKLMERLSQNQIAVQSSSVKSALPNDRETAEAFGAAEREALLAESDAAVAKRRMNAAEDDREIRQYEEATNLELAKDKAGRVKQEGENRIAEAQAEAEALAKRTAVFDGMEPGAVLAQAIMGAAERGALRQLNLDPSILESLRNVEAK